MAARLNLPEDAIHVRRRRPPAALEDAVVEVNIEEEAAGVGFDGYVRDIYEILDKVLAELQKRFDDENVTIMRGITYLCPISPSFMDENSLEAFAKLFTFKHLLERKAEPERPESLLQLQAYLQKLKEAFFELHHIALIACTLPVSSAECERNFAYSTLIQRFPKWVSRPKRGSRKILGGSRIVHEKNKL